MSISPQTGSNQSTARVDPLDRFALEIARRNKLEGESLQKLANIFPARSEEHTSELQSQAYLVCRLLLEKKKSIHQYSLLQRLSVSATTTPPPS